MLVASIIGVNTLGIHILTSDSEDISMVDVINPSKNVCSVPDGAFRELLNGTCRISRPCNSTGSVLNMVWLCNSGVVKISILR